MESVVFNAGIIAAIVAMIMVVLPTLFVGLDHKTDAISVAGVTPKWRLVFNLGIFASGVFQVIFAIQLPYRVGFIGFSLGIFLFLLGATSCALLGWFHAGRNKHHIHQALAKYFFGLCPLGGIIWGFEIRPVIGNFAIIGIVLALALIAGGSYLFEVRGRKSAAEYWGILFCTLWVLHFYFI